MDTNVIFDIKDGELEQLDVQNVADLKVELEDAMQTVKGLIDQCDEALND
ncbi:MAG: hypothetical protein N2749_02245 [Clostridia bacterium]|nr:hypothetical protein [Clostridia bacterium]